MTAALEGTRDIVERIRAGDADAFSGFFRAEYVPLVNALRHYVPTASVAEDIAQDVFAHIWMHRAALDPERSLRGYLFLSGRNRALKMHHHDAITNRYATRTVLERGPVPELASDPVPDRAMELAEVLGLVDTAVAGLSPRLREVYQLSRESGLTPHEIAGVLGTSVSTVYTQLGKIMTALQPVLQRWMEH